MNAKVERLTSEQSQLYFETRIRGSRVGAWASRQSELIEGREKLEGWVEEIEARRRSLFPSSGVG